MSLSDDHSKVLDALYRVEEAELSKGHFGGFASAAAVAAALPTSHANYNDVPWVAQKLQDLWIARRILQFPISPVTPDSFSEVVLDGIYRHGTNEDGRLRLEQNDFRGPDPDAPAGHAVVANYSGAEVCKYRSRMAEIGRLLAKNHQKFGMGPSTGLLRYELRAQRRPERNLPIATLSVEWQAMIRARKIQIDLPMGKQTFPIDSSIDLDQLATVTGAVLTALAATTPVQLLASFQANSTLAVIAGLYSSAYRREIDAHIVTAGVGSGKSYAFQLGALIHAAYCRLNRPGEKGFRVLLLYPRVALAANQFQELGHLMRQVATTLGIVLQEPTLDAGGQLVAGAVGFGVRYQKIQEHYQAVDRPILISNLDTLANRFQHPEALDGLVDNLGLIVCDEIHLSRGIYGAHMRVALRRLALLRAARRLRTRFPTQSFAQLLSKIRGERGAYCVAASATIAEPQRHTSRVLTLEAKRVLHLPIEGVENKGWIHHLFLRQKPEVSTMSALVNATSCLVHNRRDGLFREYVQAPADASGMRPSLALDQLPNPIRTAPQSLELRDPKDIHKTVGFCDSLDGIGRWSDLVSDNERTKVGHGTDENPNGSYPYYTRFIEPLWRQVHQGSFARAPDPWRDQMRAHYGTLCRQCKKGVSCSIRRVPPGMSTKGQERVEKLWDTRPDNESYLGRLEVDAAQVGEAWLDPFLAARTGTTISNLDECAFFKTGLCWWWSDDHPGSNLPRPPSAATPLNGVKQLQLRRDRRNHFVNGLRVLPFTSEAGAKLDQIKNINEVFRAPINDVFKDRAFTAPLSENATLLLGSPRLEVGVDLARVMDGITYRAMRDPSGLQQKIGRVGRETGSDSLLVHVVTMNARDLYYFRNPQIALDPGYLQAIPLHENNRIVLRHHLFMAIVDFLCLQGAEPGPRTIANQGERVFLINDHGVPQTPAGWQWEPKVIACWDYLFGTHPHAPENLANLRVYLEFLGARAEELDPQQAINFLPNGGPAFSGSGQFGAIDVFKHDFGPGLFLSKHNGQAYIAQACSSKSDSSIYQSVFPPDWHRHREFVISISAGVLGDAPVNRSYLNDLFEQGVFRRGVPAKSVPGNHPYVWPSNYFEAVGTETVRVTLDGALVGYVSVSAALSLLAPGTVTYRYKNQPAKVSVSTGQATGRPARLTTGIYGIFLNVKNPDWYEAATCPPVTGSDLPPGFYGFGPVEIFKPRQISLQLSSSEPLVALDADRFGLLADDDSAPRIIAGGNTPSESVHTPPRAFARRWFRLGPGQPGPLQIRFEDMLQAYATAGTVLPKIPMPPVLAAFDQIEFNPSLPVTDFVWGLDRQFAKRTFDGARLVYREVHSGSGSPPVAIGSAFEAPALRFSMSAGPGSLLHVFFDEVVGNPDSVTFQLLLWQSLVAYLEEHGRELLDPSAPIHGYAPPSPFALKNLKTIVLFHLLGRWHPNQMSPPPSPPIFSIADVAGCFTAGHANELIQTVFDALCNDVATVHEPVDVGQHADTLRGCWKHFALAQQSGATFDIAYVRKVAVERFANSLGLALHTAALRQSGAEDHDLAYFYEQRDNRIIWHLFDTDALGNGTTELLHENLFIPEAQKTLSEKLRLLGHPIDPLPTSDFAHCLEEELVECASSQSAHLAYHGHTSTQAPWDELAIERDSERKRAGVLYAFLKNGLNLPSFDDTVALRECPEFVAHIAANYTRLQPLNLGLAYPSYQALESAMEYCLGGCVGCLVAPERNLHGPLSARDMVNKPLLDAFFRVGVAERAKHSMPACFPGKGPGCTCAWQDRNKVASAALGQSVGAISVPLALPAPLGGSPTLLPMLLQVTKGPAPLVFRKDWSRPDQPTETVRVHMRF